MFSAKIFSGPDWDLWKKRKESFLYFYSISLTHKFTSICIFCYFVILRNIINFLIWKHWSWKIIKAIIIKWAQGNSKHCNRLELFQNVCGYIQVDFHLKTTLEAVDNCQKHFRVAYWSKFYSIKTHVKFKYQFQRKQNHNRATPNSLLFGFSSPLYTSLVNLLIILSFSKFPSLGVKIT